MPSSKADQFTLASRDTVCPCMDSISVAITLCDEMDFSFCVKVEG